MKKLSLPVGYNSDDDFCPVTRIRLSITNENLQNLQKAINVCELNPFLSDVTIQVKNNAHYFDDDRRIVKNFIPNITVFVVSSLQIVFRAEDKYCNYIESEPFTIYNEIQFS